MKKFKNLQLKTLDQHIASIHICDRPSDGWISSVRKSLGMNVRQLAEKIGIARQTVSQFENSELDNSITLKSLSRVAEAMDCKLVYAIIPNQGNLEEIIKKQAYKKAKEIVMPVNYTMLLEAQEVDNLQEKITEMTEELLNSHNIKLWDK